MIALTARFAFIILITAYSGIGPENQGIFGSPVQESPSALASKSDSTALVIGNEGACVQPPPVKMDIAWALRFSQLAKYIPMASKLYYASTAKRLTGGELRSWEELHGMCPEATSDPYSVSTISGFGYTLELICEIEWIGTLTCCPKVAEDMDGCELSRENTRIVATWTDHADYLVTISCQPDGYKAWNVVSTKKYVEPGVREEILEHIKQYGFSEENAVEISYEFC